MCVPLDVSLLSSTQGCLASAGFKRREERGDIVAGDPAIDVGVGTATTGFVVSEEGCHVITGHATILVVVSEVSRAGGAGKARGV